MNLWQKIFQITWGKRKIEAYAATPSMAQVEDAAILLKFHGSPSWPEYEEHLCVTLGEAMESAFSALKAGNTNMAMVKLARAEAVYEILTEPKTAIAIAKKNNEVIIRP